LTLNAIIIGAGIGGLSAAIALDKVGVNARVFEKASELKDVGAGIILYPNALNALRKLDVFDDVACEGSFAADGKYTNSSGKILVQLDLRTVGLAHGLLAIHRADLQRALASKVGLDNIRLGMTCERFEQSGNIVTAQMSDSSSVTGNLLIGADGLHSAIRGQVLGDGQPRYSGSFAWRGVSALPHSAMPPDSGFICFGRGLQFGATHIGKGRIYWFGAVANANGVQHRRTKTDVLSIFGRWPAPIEKLIQATPDDEILAHDLFDRDPSLNWGRGLVTLLGDAAHPMTPYMGQGGCQALEDSIALAAALKSEPDTATALRQYESMRRDRTSDFVLQSRRAQSISMTNSLLFSWMRDALLPLLPPKLVMEQFHTLANYQLPDIE